MTPKHTDIAGKLRQRFFSGLHLGILEPGIRLPSANEIAVEMGVDRRVVLQAYRELEREGIVELRQRSSNACCRKTEFFLRNPLVRYFLL